MLHTHPRECSCLSGTSQDLQSARSRGASLKDFAGKEPEKEASFDMSLNVSCIQHLYRNCEDLIHQQQEVMCSFSQAAGH